MKESESKDRAGVPPAGTPTSDKSAAGEPQGGQYAATCGIHPDLLAILVCPMGHAELRLEKDSLVCTRCGPRFAVDDGIPIMLIEEAKLPPGINRIEDLPCYPDVKARETRK